MMIWLTSDTHFGHEMLVREGHRPFESIEAHDETLITNWNSTVGKKDIVFFVGDFSFMSVDATKKLIGRLNGDIRFCPGNHDKNLIKLAKSGFGITILEKEYEFKFECMYMTINHMPMYSWNRSFYGSLMLHGHMHQTNPMGIDSNKRLYDVGVDGNEFRPVSLDAIIEKLESIPTPKDRHAIDAPRQAT